MRTRRAACTLALSVCLLVGGARALDLRRLMTVSFASGLAASSDGRHVAWVVNQSGKRNLWVADAPAWAARQITSYRTDEGMDIGELSWSPDSRMLVYTRAGSFGAARQPNPTDALQPPKSMLWTFTLTGSPRTLTEGSSATFSPGDGRIWFLRGGQVFSVARSGSQEKKEFNCLGNVLDLTWSGSGAYLAFRNERGTHSFIGIFKPESRHVAYLDPSVDMDSSPVWSPDGTQLAFLREAAATAIDLEGVRREGAPWSIHVADAASVVAHEVFRADRGRGSVHQNWESSKQLFWSAANAIYFGWERTGWLHLYSVPAAGGTPRELTPGDGEINAVSQSPDRRSLTYSSNIGDIERSHVAMLAPGDDVPRSITGGSGGEWNPVPISGENSVAFIASTYNSASHVELVTATASSRRSLGPPATVAGLMEPEAVIFNSTDKLAIHAELFRPSGAARHPAIIFVHGGSRRQMWPGFHPMYYYSNAYELNQYLASLGFVVLSVNYRSGIGYGLEFREAPGFGPAGASEYDDVKAGAEYLKTRVDVDPARIGIWGGSWGGYLAALALARDSDTFKAGVDFHGVHDWRFEMDAGAETPERTEWERQAFAASPLASIATWRSPVLLIHGDDDRTVPFIETVRLVEELRKHDVPFEQLIFPGEIHDMLLWDHWVEAYTKAADFFNRSLHPSQPSR